MPFIPEDHVCLLLIEVDEEEVEEEEGGEEVVEVEGGEEEEEKDGSEGLFYLCIPLDTINNLCLTPRKYLLYLAWCILGLDGEFPSLALGLAGEDGEFHEIDDDGDLEGGGIYNLILGDPLPDMAVVDLEVIKARTAIPSETTGTRDGFRKQLLQRDICCVFTGLHPQLGESLHIIPFKWGSEWFRLIIQNRPHENDDDLEGLDDISDVRNGFFATCAIHPVFDARTVAILKTPNPFLDVNDISPHPHRILGPLHDDVDYPEDSRYSVQWLDPLDRGAQVLLPNNSDAAFGKDSEALKPSALLLHYNYGAAAIKCWGRNIHILDSYAKGSRPPKPVPVPSGPNTNIHDRTIAIEKRRKAMEKAKKTKGPKSKGSKSKGSKRKAAWDEDDVMLFFWGNSKAARERYLKTHEAKREILEEWRQGLPLAL